MNHFVSQEDISLYIPRRNIFTVLAHLRSGMRDRRATFDLYVRDMPPHRNYLMFCGLEEVVDYVRGFRFSDDDFEFLKGITSLSSEEEAFFRNFRFRGDVAAMREGTVFFPYEPVIRLTATVVELQLMEAVLMNVVGFQTMIASKVARVYHAATPDGFIVGEFRSHGLEAAVKAARSGYIAGMSSVSLLLAEKWLGVPTYGGTASHFFISSFPSELEAFRSYLSAHPHGSVMVDTYDTEQGVRNAVTVAREMEARGDRLSGIVLDSGDLAELSRMARKILDENGCAHTKIIGMSNLDEYRIRELKRRGARLDFYGMTTEVVTSADAPKLEIVYKLSEIEDEGRWSPRAKFSTGKETYAGRKQVYRSGAGDVIGLESEDIEGETLLQPVLRSGELCEALPELSEIRKHALDQYERLPTELFDTLDAEVAYPVRFSDGVARATEEAKQRGVPVE